MLSQKSPAGTISGSAGTAPPMPFTVTDLLRLVILIAFPIIATWLPSQM
jgi:C4-dicarboxylate transporter DctM subunit